MVIGGEYIMNIPKKMTPTLRQKFILHSLRNSHKPITGNDLAKETNVSRQVIVQDISILKAKKEPIVATSQGYLYINNQANTIQHMIAVHHSPEQTQNELYIIVDHGVTVKDVTVEHAVYGELTAAIMVSNRAEVDQFIEKINETNATYLSVLTEGIHLHTLEADSMEKIEAACKALSKANLLLKI